jgi:phenylacetate-CoA ligase
MSGGKPDMFWNPSYEQMDREELGTIQLSRLRKTVELTYEKVAFYKKALDERGITPKDIRSLEDIQYLPFTTKDDLRDNYPFGMFAVPSDEIVRIHSSSGTTGKPTVVGYTKNDIETWSELIARSITAAGAGKRDIVHISYGYGLFTGGLGIHYGVEKVGATVVPVSGGNTKRQIMLMKDFGATFLACTPSYSLYMAETAEEMGISMQSLPLKAGIFGAEPWSDNMRKEIERKLGINAFDIYGLSEVMGPGVAYECPEKRGLHIPEDHFIAEIVDPVTLKPLPYGEKGELVFTSLTKECFPVLRYRTKDITSLNPQPCPCGRTHLRMDRVSGRSDDMLIIRGVNVFPSQIETVLLSIGETEPHYQLIVERVNGLDELEVWVEVTEKMFSDEVRRLEQLEKRIQTDIDTILGINSKVKLVEPKTIPRSEGKAKRVIDKRAL